MLGSVKGGNLSQYGCWTCSNWNLGFHQCFASITWNDLMTCHINGSISMPTHLSTYSLQSSKWQNQISKLKLVQNISKQTLKEFCCSSIISALLLSHGVALCADTTMTVSTGSSRISAPAEIGRTWRIIPIQTTAHPIATTQSGKQSSEPQPAGPALPETSAHPTTLAHPWDTAHLSTTRQTIRAHQSRSGPAARHNRSYPGLLLATIDSATQQMPYRDCGLYPKAVQSTVYQSVHGCHLLTSAAADLWNLGDEHQGAAPIRQQIIKNQRIFLYLRV